VARRLYSTVTRGTWSDARFLALSAPDPNAQTLWLYLLTCDLQGPIPGLFRAGVGAISDGLGWGIVDTAKALDEVEAAGLVLISVRPPLIWMPNAVRHNPPASPNVVRSWARPFAELPECELRDVAVLSIRGGLREAFRAAFDEAFSGLIDEASSGRKPSRKPSRKPLPKACPNQEQEQEQENKRRNPPLWSEALSLAETLRESIRTHSPDVAEKYDRAGALRPWATALERLLRIDKAEPHDVAGVIRWAHETDPRGFWRPNLLSGAKVRKHFDSLKVQARQAGAVGAAGSTSAQGWLDAHHPWLLRWYDETTAIGREPVPRLLLVACGVHKIPLPPDPGAAVRWARGRR